MTEGMIGEIRLFGGNFAPRAWAFCQGQLLAISSNEALFSILGTTYGGDGRTTFGLPDCRGRMVLSSGNGPGLSSRRLGSRGGQEDVTLFTPQLPNHNHTISGRMIGSSGAPDTSDATNELFATQPVGNNFFATDSGASDHDMANGTASVTIAASGGGQPHENRPPFLALHYVICLQGIFPSRS